MTKLHQLTDLGQAVWFDYIRRSFTRNGELQALIDQGVRGVTSNPAIFEKAIAGSDDYKLRLGDARPGIDDRRFTRGGLAGVYAAELSRAGLAAAKGDAVLCISADGQDDPSAAMTAVGSKCRVCKAPAVIDLPRNMLINFPHLLADVNLVMLTCDAFGVLPPVSKLSPEQAMYHFISGYTAKVAGTERGVKEPQATFSACFGAPFMPLHPTVYADLLGEKIAKHGSTCWLVNTGWTGGAYGTGSRMPIKATRALLKAALRATATTTRASRSSWTDTSRPAATAA